MSTKSPVAWPEKALLELIEPLQSGSRPKGGVRDIAAGVPSIGGEHLTSRGTFNFANVKYVPEAFFESMRRGRIQCGDVLVVKDGATTGKVALVRSDFPFERAVVNEHVFICRPSEDVTPDYLFWFLYSPEGQRRILEHFQGSAQGGINQSFAVGTHVPLAPHEEQRRLVALIEAAASKADAATHRLARACSALQRFHQAVLLAACSGQLTADWREGNPNVTSDALVEELRSKRLAVARRGVRSPLDIRETDLPEIPPTWDWVAVDSLASTVVDGVHKTPTYVPEGVPFVTVRNLTAAREISFERCKYITPADHEALTARTKPELGDLLISKDGTIGVTRAVRTDREFSIFVSVALVKPLMYEMTDYLELAFQSPQVQRQMVGVGSGLTHLVLRELKADAIPLPSLEEQGEIVRRVDQLLTLADLLHDRVAAASTRVERSTHAVLAKAFRGDLSLSSNGSVRDG